MYKSISFSMLYIIIEKNLIIILIYYVEITAIIPVFKFFYLINQSYFSYCTNINICQFIK